MDHPCELPLSWLAELLKATLELDWARIVVQLQPVCKGGVQAAGL